MSTRSSKAPAASTSAIRGCRFPARRIIFGETAPTPWYDIKDPAKAKELLKQAGYKNEKIIIETNSNYQWMRSTMLIVAEQLKAAGMTVDVQVTDWTTNARTCSRAPATGTCPPPPSGPTTFWGRSSGGR